VTAITLAIGVGASFSLGGSPADYRDLLISRSALNADEVAALEEGRLLQASLEVYSPLAGMKVQPGGTVQNLAQDRTAAKIAAAGVQHTGR
jgi:hypothetical protein